MLCSRLTHKNPAPNASEKIPKMSQAFKALTASLAGLAMLAGTESALAQKPLGIDVSSYQGGSINWNSVKSGGYIFAWTKATEGLGYFDADFIINENGGKNAGVYMGAYHYCHPENNSYSSEVSYFWSKAGAYIQADGLTLMPMLDVEGNAFNGHVGTTTLSQWVCGWCNGVSNNASLNGVYIKPFIYISSCNAGNLDTSVAGFGSDIANYGSANGTANPQTGTPWSVCSGDNQWGGWTVWQFESTNFTGVPGIASKSIDCDVYNGTAAGLFNSWVATSTATGGIFRYWDPQAKNSANPYTGSMTGYWESNNWSTSVAGQTSPIGWDEGKCAVIGVNTGSSTPAFTITMNNSHTVAGFFDGGYNGVLGGNVTITGPGIISMAAGAQGMDVPNSYDSLNISNTIAGTGQVVPEGSGSLYLNGTNTYSGGTQIGYAGNGFTGKLYFNNNSSFSTGAIVTSNGFGCALLAEGSDPITISNPVTIPVASSVNIVGNPAGITFSGPWALNNSLILSTGGAANNLITIAGPISGSGAFLQKANVGILALSGTNTYTGPTTISTGTLNITDAGKLGNGTYAGRITNNATLIYSSTASQTLTGVISGTGSLTQSNGVLTLAGNNTFSGNTTVASGLLQVSNDLNLGTAPASFIANSITLNGGIAGNYGLRIQNGNVTLNANRGITLGTMGGAIQVAQGNTLTYNGVISGSGAFQAGTSPTVGYGTINLGGANTYTGPTIIACGTLQLGANGTLPSGTPLIIASANNVPGTLDMNGKSQTIGALSSSMGINGTGTGTPGIKLSGALTILENSDTEFDGNIIGSGGSLTLNGGSTLTLNGTNSYTGPTTITAGTLALGATGSISNSALVTIAAGGTLDVSAIPAFSLSSSTVLNSGGSAVAATISGALGGTVNLGSQPVTLVYDGSHPALTISQGALVLNGNTFIVNGSILPMGTYPLIQVASGSVSASGRFVVTGTAIGSGMAGAISINGGTVNLVVQPAPFQITTGSLDATGKNLIMTWQAIPGATYQILGTSNITDPLSVWTNVGEAIVATNTTISTTNPVYPGGSGFYTIKAH